MKNRIFFSASILFFLLSVIACKKKDQSSLAHDGLTDMEARKYISAYTQGMIKETDAIEFRFVEKYQFEASKVQRAISVRPFFEFKIELDSLGKGFKMIPKDKLKRGESYEVELRLHKIINTSGSVKLISRFKVFEQFVSVQREGLVIDDQNNSFVQIHVSTSIEEAKEKIVSLFDYPKNKIQINPISSREYSVKLSFNPSDGTKTVSWSGASIGSKEKGMIEVWNYDNDEFNVVNTYFNRSLSEYNVYFTKLLDETQDAKGLIRLGKEDAEYQIKNNQITIFIKTKTNQDVDLSISRGLKAKDGATLPLDLKYKIEVAVVKPEVNWLEDGIYIPSTGEFKVPFQAKALKSVVVSVVAIRSENASRFAAWNNMNTLDQMEMIRYGNLVHKSTYNLDSLTSNNLEEWNEFGIDLTYVFKREKGTIYNIHLSYGPANTILNCEDSSVYDFEKETVDESWFENRNRHYRYYGYYDYRKENDPCHVSYYLARPNIAKNIHCTNVFPIIKKGEKEVHIAVKELLTNQVAKGAKVELISLQGLDITASEVSSNGVCVFKNLKREAHAVRITYLNEISYFNLYSGEENSITEFDVSSNVRDVDNRIFVYTEREVWRPSDTIFMDVMLNRTNFHFEAGLPIVVRLKNPKNVLYKKYLLPIKDGQSIYSFKMPTHLEAATGYWKVNIEIGPLKKSKTLRVETIKPNVVDLEYDYTGEEEGWIYNNTIKGNLEVNYLAGYAMRNGKVNGSANIFLVNNPFNEFTNFVFHPYNRPNQVQDAKLWSVKTDLDGKANFSYTQDFKRYKGVSKMVIDSKIDLPGGGLNTETESKLVSPFETYVGIEKARGRGWRGSYRYGETPSIEIIRVDQKGKLKKENATVNLQVYHYQKDWWYDRYRLSRGHRSHGSYKYVKVLDEKIELVNGRTKYIHDVAKNKSGMYKMIVTDPSSGHIAEYEFHSVVTSNYSVQSNPIFINLEMEKNNFDVGETMEVKLPELKDAKALISIERGTDVLHLFWQELNQGPVQIPIKEEWFPNFYLNVSIVQNYGQRNNDRPMRMYTVEKILVNQPDDGIEPVVEVAEKIEPNKTFTFEVAEKNGQAMEYTVALVDIGLLNLTGFRTPDPMTHFSKMIALRVKTWDIFQQLIYHLNPSFAGIFSIGGDESAEKMLDESADFNRFEPVVFHLGSIHLEANAKNKHSITMPNYIGSVKLMLIACNDRSFGNFEKNLKVVSPLMVQSQLPRTLNVTDEVDVPVTFFKDDPRIKDVQLSANASNDLIQFSTPSLTTSLANSDQALESLSFSVGEQSGTTDITFNASGSGFKAFEETKLFINYPNSYSDRQDIYQIKAGESLDIPIESFGFDKTKHVDLQVSGALVPNFTKHYHELIRYPHGCLEQTVSRAIGMLYIDDLMALTPTERMQNRDYLDAAILKIQSYQRHDGRFNYWRNGYYHHWSDLYAGHYLIAARDKNLLFKDDALKLWINHVTNLANQWQIAGVADKYFVHREEVLQAYRLYLLAKAGKPAKSAMNRFRNRSLEPQIAKMFLAGAYFYTGMNDIGKSLLDQALRQGHSDKVYGYSFGSNVRNKAIVVYIMSLFDRSNKLDSYYADWVKEVNQSRWLSTQDQGFAFMACAAYFGEKQNIAAEVDFELISNVFKKRHKMPSDKQERFSWGWEQLSDKATIKNHGSSEIFIHKTQRAISKELYQLADANGISLSVQYLKLNGEQLDLKNIKQGEEILISVYIKNTDILDQENLALTVKAPSGWELLNPRLYTTNADTNANFVFQDFKDDKVYTYFNLSKNKGRSYQFRAKANLTGDYYLPAVRCENMYKGDVYAFSKAGRAVIK